MKKHGLTFVFCLFLSFMLSLEARADIEAIQAMITQCDVFQGFQEYVIKGKSLIESVKQLEAQVKQTVDEVKGSVEEAKATVEKGKQAIESAKEKAEAIKAKAQGIVDAIKNKDVNGLKSGLSSLDFSAFKYTFNGKQNDNEMSDTVLNTLVRQKGSDSISNQEELSKAINKKNGMDIAKLYAQGMVTRQNIKQEKDELKNPETIEESLDLCQKAQISLMKRQNEISGMEGNNARFIHTRAMENVGGSYEKGAQNE